MKRILVLIPAASILLLACPADDADAPRIDGMSPVDDGDPSGAAICLQGEPFVADGPIPVRVVEPGDGRQIGELRWQRYEGCERFVIDLLAEDGSPADRPGHVTAEVLRDVGVVRVTLRDVPHVDPDATDAPFDGPLAEAAYAVSSPEGRWTYVDVHLADAAEAHVVMLDGPARVIVDLRPGGSPVPEPAARSARVVVLEPRPGAASYPLTVTGYARTFEANVVVRLEQDGEDAFEDFTTATAWVDAWGHYLVAIAEGPAGRVVLHVGEYSAKDGTWEGAVIALDMRTVGR